MTALSLHEHEQVQEYDVIFAPDAGFNPSWWARLESRPRTAWKTHYYSALRDDVEVARAWVDSAARLEDGYLGIPAHSNAVEIVRIEVRVNERCAGLGPAFVGLLLEAHSPALFFARSHDDRSDRFWKKIGWKRHHRSDEDPQRPPLFILNL